MEQRSSDITWLPPQPAEPPSPPAWPPAGPEPKRESPLKRLFGPLLLVGALALKWGKAALLLLPKAKLLTTSASMLVSVAAYALIWGWKFAAGFVALLFVHEMGHYIQLRREGVRPSGMVFIPFLGAAVFSRSLGGNALAEARVGLAGPVLGSLAAGALIPIANAADSDFLRALAFTGLFLNLFNLIPMLPFDGGRAMAAMAPWMWFVGFGAMVLLFFVWPNPVLILFILIGAFDLYGRWKNRHEARASGYYDVKPRHRVVVFAVYLLLIVGCALGMDASFVERDFGDV
jgi:Zn-dependent protease